MKPPLIHRVFAVVMMRKEAYTEDIAHDVGESKRIVSLKLHKLKKSGYVRKQGENLWVLV